MEEDKNTIESSFTHEAVKRQQQRNGDRIMRRFVLVLVIALIAFVLYIVHNSRCNYYSVVKTESTEDNNSVSYEPFKDGYIKYGSSGIEYQEEFGTSVWNESATLQNPMIAKSENYILITNRGSSKLSIYNETGKVNDISLKNAVVQASISDQGVCEVILQNDETSLIQVYDKDGNLLVDSKYSISETGYPVTAAISPDGTKLAISSYGLESTTTHTTVTVYDLSGNQKSEDGNSELGQKTYKDEIIPKLYFYDEDHLAACSDQNLYFYNVSSSLKQSEKVELQGDVESVFTDDQIFGVIMENTEDISEGKYVFATYNAKGKQVIKKILDMSYEQLDIRDHQIFAIYKNQCTIMDIKGRVLFQGEIEDGGIVTIIPASGWRNYHVVTNDKIVKIRLQFWSH